MTCFNNCGNDREPNRLFCSDKCRYGYFSKNLIKNPPSEEYKKIGGNPRLYRSNPIKNLDKDTGEVKLVWKQEEIKWGKELSFPDFAGIEVKITYKQYHGEIYDFNTTKGTGNKISEKRYEQFVEHISRSLRILWTEHGFLTPYILSVNEDGKIHLILTHQFNKNTVVDIVLRDGSTEIVKKTKVVKDKK